MTRLAALLLALVVFVAACSGDDGDDTTTTGAAGTGDGDTVTTLADATATGDTTATADDTVTTTTTDLGGGPVIPDFEIVSRVEGPDGDTLVVVLDPTSYERLSDIDIQNVASRVVEEFPPVSVAYFINDERLADVMLDPDAGDDETEQLLDVAYLAELEDGRLTFQGTFSDSGVVILGS